MFELTGSQPSPRGNRGPDSACTLRALVLLLALLYFGPGGVEFPVPQQPAAVAAPSTRGDAAVTDTH